MIRPSGNCMGPGGGHEAAGTEDGLCDPGPCDRRSDRGGVGFESTGRLLPASCGWGGRFASAPRTPENGLETARPGTLIAPAIPGTFIPCGGGALDGITWGGGSWTGR